MVAKADNGAKLSTFVPNRNVKDRNDDDNEGLWQREQNTRRLTALSIRNSVRRSRLIDCGKPVAHISGAESNERRKNFISTRR